MKFDFVVSFKLVNRLARVQKYSAGCEVIYFHIHVLDIYSLAELTLSFCHLRNSIESTKETLFSYNYCVKTLYFYKYTVSNFEDNTILR